jgi:hypothetical protein
VRDIFRSPPTPRVCIERYLFGYMSTHLSEKRSNQKKGKHFHGGHTENERKRVNILRIKF